MTSQFFQLGQKAYNNNIHAPAQDVAFDATFAELHGETAIGDKRNTKALKAWWEGYYAAKQAYMKAKFPQMYAA